MPHRTARRRSIDLPAHDALQGLSPDERLEVIRRLNVHFERHPAARVMSWLMVLLSMVAGRELSTKRNAPTRADGRVIRSNVQRM